MLGGLVPLCRGRDLVEFGITVFYGELERETRGSPNFGTESGSTGSSKLSGQGKVSTTRGDFSPWRQRSAKVGRCSVLTTDRRHVAPV